MNNNILFVTHHNNDFDNFLPVIIGLKNKNIRVNVLALYNNCEILQNKLQDMVCRDNDIVLDSFTDFYRPFFLTGVVVKVYKNILSRNILDSKIFLNRRSYSFIVKDFFKNPMLSLLRLFRGLCNFYLRVGSLFLLDSKKLIEYLQGNKIGFVVTDMKRADSKMLGTSKWNKLFVFLRNGFLDTIRTSIFMVLEQARDNNIRVLMVPHGNYPVLHNNDINSFYTIGGYNGFKPDYLFLENKHTRELYKDISGVRGTNVLGVPRFDIDWVKKLDGYASNIKLSCGRNNSKIVLLYIVDAFPYIRDRSKLWIYHYRMNKEIISVVNELDDVEMWVKHHPRNDHRIPIESFIQPDKQGCVKQFGIGFDTNVLIANSDIVISQLSSVLLSPVILGKPVVVFEKWKELLPGVVTIFDGLKYKAVDKNSLINVLNDIEQNGYHLPTGFIEGFCKQIFPIDKIGSTMTRNYVECIEMFLNEKNA